MKQTLPRNDGALVAPDTIPRTGHLMRPLLVLAQLFLVLIVIWRYELESRTFFNVVAIATIGFAIHAALPLAYRLPFFVCLSLTTIVAAFGLSDGAWMIGLGLILIGICHLPFRLAARVSLLVAVGAAFALFRAGAMQGPWSTAIWPILGSMFMFRLALYVYALEHEEKQPTVARTLAYFFMLPNVCFPLYPVIDYQNFRRNYFDRDANAIYETGVKWIVRGLVQLILYRYVYLVLVGDTTSVETLGELVQFLISTFLLYLRISGQFHLICGLLYLFGFRLPETHHLYFLASSFTDFWRRINIYWKDFMMKLFYYPAFFRLKKHGPRAAIVAATLIVFLSTWLLHSYQWFWLRGGFPLEPQDGLFWGLLGLLVVMGSLRELRSSTRRRLAGASSRWSFPLALRTVGTFAAICVLWSLWSTDSLMRWLVMWTAAVNTNAKELLVLAALLAAGLVIAGRPWKNLDSVIPPGETRLKPQSFVPFLGLAILAALSVRDWYAPVLPAVAKAVATVQTSTLNTRDRALQQKGYYENLDNQSRMSAQLWDLTEKKPAHWVSLNQAGAYRVRNDFLRGELLPGVRVNFNDAPLTTNSLGMRDQERALAKPKDVYRIAVLGPSHVMGSGIADEDTFTRLLESRLNADKAAGAERRIEVLNFGVAAYALTQQLAQLEEHVLRFQPDAVLFVDSPKMADPLVQHLLHTIADRQRSPYRLVNEVIHASGADLLGREGIPVPFDWLRALVGHLGVETRMPWMEAERRLTRASSQIVRATFDEMAALATRQGAVPVFLALDIVSRSPEETPRALQTATNAGMLVFNLLELWNGLDFDPIRIAKFDNHPNAKGNAMIAQRLADLFERHARELRLAP